MITEETKKAIANSLAEGLTGQTLPVLDHGFVKLLDYMGNDATIASRARMSNDLDTQVKSIEDNAKLIDYLWRNGHTSPFEMVEFTFEMKLPIFVARQLVRHRTASINEVSARYTELPEEFYIPEDFHNASASVKQGRSNNAHEDSTAYKALYKRTMEEAFSLYKEAVKEGVSKEEARIILPVATYTRWAWKMDLNNLLKTLSLRCDSHAQYEIRVYAEAMLELIRPIVPQAVEAWERHSRNSVKLTPEEAEYLRETVKIWESVVGTPAPWHTEDHRLVRILHEKLGLPAPITDPVASAVEEAKAFVKALIKD